jgi:ferric-dicitrate binding protein FerR (iron transport regulator)
MQELLERYFYGKPSETERLSLFAAIEKDADLKAEFIRLQNMNGLIAFSFPEGDHSETAKAALQRFYAGLKATSRRRYLRSFYRYAAAIVVAVLGTFFTVHYLTNDTGVSYSEIVVPVGQHVNITLADGSRVWLNSRSKLRIPKSFDRKSRKVYLDGEAFFIVEKDASKPFTVETSRYDVQVLGTQFNVLNYSEMTLFETTLIEGAVEIAKPGDNKTIALSCDERVRLINNRLKKSKVNGSDLVSWKDGVFTFDAEPFSEIIKKLELYYDVKFIVQNTQAMDVVYTGKFRVSDSAEKIIHLIRQTNKFDYRVSSDNKIIYIR